MNHYELFQLEWEKGTKLCGIKADSSNPRVNWSESSSCLRRRAHGTSKLEQRLKARATTLREDLKPKPELVEWGLGELQHSVGYDRIGTDACEMQAVEAS